MTDAIDAAIAAPQPEMRAELQLQLPSGRVVALNLPVGLDAADVVALMVNVPGAVAQVNAQAHGAAGRIALPNGGLHVVGRQ